MRFVIIISLLGLFLGAEKGEENTPWIVVPYPNHVCVQQGMFSFSKGIDILYDDSAIDSSLEATISFFEVKLNDLGFQINKESGRPIQVNLTDTGNENSEAYTLDITTDRVRIEAANSSGIYYALITILQQLLHTDSAEIPCGIVEDSPRFGYRGFMLDESRHFFGKEKVMQLLDLMALFKLNTFHWHLTDAPGWRIEINAYPKLTSVGGIGNHSDPDAPAQFYTQNEIREIVAYAAERKIMIIPEIDMPGHATAANRAYPEFSGGGSEKRPDFTFNPGKEGTYTYLSTILREVSGMFPSGVIHFGGDEVHFGNQQWGEKDSVRLLMEREQLADLKEVEYYFSNRMADTIKSLGKVAGGWDEVVDAGLDHDSTLVYWWRHDKPEKLYTSLSRGYRTVLCPRRPLYFDFVQHETHANGRRWGGFNPLEDVYGYPDNKHSFTPAESAYIKGIQACLWTEKFTTPAWVDFMSFPRLAALAESSWTSKHNKSYVRFEESLPAIYIYLDKLNIYYSDYQNENHRTEPDI